MSAFTSELEDRFTAHVCAVNGRCSRARLAALRERCAGSDSVLSLGQLLVRERLLRASEYLELRRWIERPLLRCPACEQPFSLAEGEHAGEDGAVLRCPHCGTISEPDALLEAIDPDALRLPAREDADAAGRLLSGRESQILGRTIGGYEIVGVLGVGAMGVVYRARQLELDRLVALKVLRAGEQASGAQLERFLAEARAVARLQHPGIVRIHEIGHEQGVHFFSMELIEGPTLQQVLEDEGRLEPARAAELLEQVARAVHYAHERGIVHRDLKPGNILLDAEGRPHITDFGLAHDTGRDTSLTRSGVAIGTPLYMSPEQVRGDSQAVGPASDVFALGTILYRTLTATL
ncbi:MAG: serine/threonine protein kinase, partial [Planctomycetota bacterium]